MHCCLAQLAQEHIPGAQKSNVRAWPAFLSVSHLATGSSNNADLRTNTQMCVSLIKYSSRERVEQKIKELSCSWKRTVFEMLHNKGASAGLGGSATLRGRWSHSQPAVPKSRGLSAGFSSPVLCFDRLSQWLAISFCFPLFSTVFPGSADTLLLWLFSSSPNIWPKQKKTLKNHCLAAAVGF